jgi:phenylacetate-CoA oxygenase PaaI subunit
MTGEVATSVAVNDLVGRLADNKLFLGRRYAEWCTGAPKLEAAVAAASMAQDEIGHARSFYPLLQDLAGPSSETEPETRSRFTHVEILSCPFQSWTDFVAANLLLDTALTVLLEAAADSSLGPLGQRARRILEEEPLHWLHGEGWTRRLAAWDSGVKTALTASLTKTTPYCDQILAAASPELVELGVLDAPSSTVRQRFRDRIRPVMLAADLPAL